RKQVAGRRRSRGGRRFVELQIDVPAKLREHTDRNDDAVRYGTTCDTVWRLKIPSLMELREMFAFSVPVPHLAEGCAIRAVELLGSQLHRFQRKNTHDRSRPLRCAAVTSSLCDDDGRGDSIAEVHPPSLSHPP